MTTLTITQAERHSDRLAKEENLYKIGAAASAVGVTPIVLRAWEKRYGFLKPSRQAGKQRLYSDEDIAVLKRAAILIDGGMTIGEVAALGREELLRRPLEAHARSAAVSALIGDIPEALMAPIARLAPSHLARRRSQRFAGEELAVSIGSLAIADVATLLRIYHLVKGLYEIWTYMEHRAVAGVVARQLQSLAEPAFRSEVLQMGSSTWGEDRLLRSALLDARAGALSLLVERCDQLGARSPSPVELSVLLTLARDHAKVLRNAFHDLDPALRRADEEAKSHDILPILFKLEHLQGFGRVQQVGTNYRGPITSRCLETSALDRVLYDTLARFADGLRGPDLWVWPTPSELTRWAFQSTQAAAFRPFAEDDLSTRAVALAVGVTPAQALAQGYLGWQRDRESLWAWFHWPIYEPPADVPRCECHPLGTTS